MSLAGDFAGCVSDAVANGVNVVQLRDKDLPEVERAALARRLVDAIDDRAMLLINGSVKIAREVGAAGVHFPEGTNVNEDTSGLIVGRSVHSLRAAKRAVEKGADYLIVGPVFSTKTHPGEATPVGWKLVRDIAEAWSVSVIAIGGLNPVRVPRMIQAGASGVAAIRTLVEPASARSMRAALDQAFAVRTRSRT